MDQVTQDHYQPPATTHTNNDGASTTSGESEGMARLPDLVIELKSNTGARLPKVEARRSEDNEASAVSVGSSTFWAYAESLPGLGRQMTLSSLEDEIVPSPAWHHTVGQVHQRMDSADDRQDSPIQPPRDTGHRPVPAPTYFAAQRLLQIRDLNLSIGSFDGKEVYPGLEAGFLALKRGSCGR